MVLRERSEFAKFHQSVHENFEEISERIYDLVATPTAFRSVFCHVDLWSCNVMFKREANKARAVIIDFQTCQYLPPAVDVMLAIFLNTRRASRESHLEDLLRFYYDELGTALLRKVEIDFASLLSWTDFRRSCDHYELLALLFMCRYAPFSHIPKNVLREMENEDPNRYARVCGMDRGTFILEWLNRDEHFREVVIESLMELTEKFF